MPRMFQFSALAQADFILRSSSFWGIHLIVYQIKKQEYIIMNMNFTKQVQGFVMFYRPCFIADWNEVFCNSFHLSHQFFYDQVIQAGIRC